MRKLPNRLFLFELIFLCAGGFIIYQGFSADIHAVTSDGYSLRNYYIVAGVLTALIPVVIVAGTTAFGMFKRKQINFLLDNGTQGVATILNLTDTGVRINNELRVKLFLEILVPNYEPYRAYKTITLSSIYLAQLQTGSIINVMVDPTQPSNESRIGLLLK